MATIGVGDVAPELKATWLDAEDQPHVLAEALSRGPIVLGMYKSSCQASKTMFPFLQRLADTYGKDGLSVFGVAQDSANITRSFGRRLDLSIPILIEGPEFPISRAYDIFATPTVYLVGKDGKVAWSTMGFLKPQINEMSDAVAASLGVDPAPIVGDADADVPMFVPG
ncbi:MAG: peroxiredoxin family protein [Thermomicrobiales bacterium]